MRRRHVSVLAVGLFVVLSHGVAGAQDAAVSPTTGSHDHDGFFLRLVAGAGYTRFKIGSRSSDAASVDVSAAIGGALSPRLVLFGELFTVLAPSSNMPFDVNGEIRDDTRYGFAGLGPGVAIFIPSNSYASLTLGITQQTLEADLGDDYVFTAKTKTGMGAQLMAGHEWWIARNWGLGVGVKGYFSTNRGDELYDEERATTWGLNLGISGTLDFASERTAVTAIEDGSDGSSGDGPGSPAAPGGDGPATKPTPPASARPGYHEHDGFFARLGFGLGYGRFQLGNTSNTVAGGGYLAIGKAIGNNLVLFGEFFDNVIIESRFRADEGGVPTYDRAIVRFLGLGPGITYYTPSNCYLTATIAMTQSLVDFAPFDPDNEWVESKPGIGGAVGVAREWWVAGNWGLGVAFRTAFTVNEMGDELDNELITALTSTIGLTVTLN